MSDDELEPPPAGSLAGEYSLGVLTGEELREAETLMRTDPAFRAEVARWTGRLAPMLAEIDPVAPPPAAWIGIEGQLGGGREANDNVLLLKRSVGRWRGVAALTTALAACLAVVVVSNAVRPVPTPPPVEQASAAPLVAMLGEKGEETKVVASWDPSARQLVLAVAGDMPSDAAHAHELWVIPQGGQPRSLGTMPASKQMHMRLADAIAQLLQQGATIAISVEPRGGSPTGSPTGPVVASGPLSKA